MTQLIHTLVGIFQSSGFARFGEPGGWLYAVMICVVWLFAVPGHREGIRAPILLPMAFGMIRQTCRAAASSTWNISSVTVWNTPCGSRS